MTSTPIFVGIDIAKADFVVACRPTGTSWTALNAAAGIAATVDRLRALAPSLIVLEATGGYETALVVALAAAPRDHPAHPLARAPGHDGGSRSRWHATEEPGLAREREPAPQRTGGRARRETEIPRAPATRPAFGRSASSLLSSLLLSVHSSDIGGIRASLALLP